MSNLVKVIVQFKKVRLLIILVSKILKKKYKNLKGTINKLQPNCNKWLNQIIKMYNIYL